MNPDLVFRDRIGEVRAVIDAKYKRSDAQADCYQALAYAKGLSVKRVALIYPEDGEVLPATHYIVNDNIEILVRTLPVGHGGAGFTKLESRLTAAVRSILDERNVRRQRPNRIEPDCITPPDKPHPDLDPLQWSLVE